MRATPKPNDVATKVLGTIVAAIIVTGVPTGTYFLIQKQAKEAVHEEVEQQVKPYVDKAREHEAKAAESARLAQEAQMKSLQNALDTLAHAKEAMDRAKEAIDAAERAKASVSVASAHKQRAEKAAKDAEIAVNEAKKAEDGAKTTAGMTKAEGDEVLRKLKALREKIEADMRASPRGYFSIR